MQFYTLNNGAPAPLPFRITMPDGSTRTDPSSFTAEEIAAAGYTEAPAPPPYEDTTQDPPHWNGSEWTIRDLTPEEIAARTVPESVPRHALKIAMLREDPASVGQVDSAIAAMPEAQRIEAEISWREAPTIRRSAILVGQLAAVLGWDTDRVTGVFIDAQAVSDEIAG